MTTQQLERPATMLWTQRPGETVSESTSLQFYGAMDAVEPCTSFGLAAEAMLPVSLAQRWLAEETAAGRLVRDIAAGRYRSSCPL